MLTLTLQCHEAGLGSVETDSGETGVRFEFIESDSLGTVKNTKFKFEELVLSAT